MGLAGRQRNGERYRAGAGQRPELNELVEYGELTPLDDAGPQERSFSVACVGPLRTAHKQRQDFDLDLFTVG
jgi:chaperone modulatory protein CbpM